MEELIKYHYKHDETIFSVSTVQILDLIIFVRTSPEKKKQRHSCVIIITIKYIYYILCYIIGRQLDIVECKTRCVLIRKSHWVEINLSKDKQYKRKYATATLLILYVWYIKPIWHIKHIKPVFNFQEKTLNINISIALKIISATK